jgi:hypothetical protein
MDAASGKLAITSEGKPVVTRMPTPEVERASNEGR